MNNPDPNGQAVDLSNEASPAIQSILGALGVVKATGEPSRPRSLCVTKLEEALFWLQHDEHLTSLEALEKAPEILL